MDEKIAIVSLGANLGERARTLSSALRRLGDYSLHVVAVSPFYETVPVGVSEEQPDFLNAVAVLSVPQKETPETLLQILLKTEREFGRERSFPNAPRTCDLDLIFFEEEMCNSGALTLPHPRWKERAFVLVPLCDVLKTSDPQPWLGRKIWQERAQETQKLLQEIDTSGVKPWSPPSETELAFEA